MLILGSTEIYTINNSDVYDTYKDLYLSKIKKTFDKKFSIPLDFDFFKHPLYLYGLKEDLVVRLELNSSEKVVLCTGDTSATYKLSDISLEYHAIFNEPYATTIGKMYTGTTSILYTKLTSIHYQTLSKRDTT